MKNSGKTFEIYGTELPCMLMYNSRNFGNLYVNIFFNLTYKRVINGLNSFKLFNSLSLIQLFRVKTLLLNYLKFWTKFWHKKFTSTYKQVYTVNINITHLSICSIDF